MEEDDMIFEVTVYSRNWNIDPISIRAGRLIKEDSVGITFIDTTDNTVLHWPWSSIERIESRKIESEGESNEFSEIPS